MTVRGFVFDLDGTLARTESLGAGRRTPWQLLQPGLTGADPTRWAVSEAVSRLPGTLISLGYRVAVATRAPIAYASTLSHLLSLDSHELVASCGAGLSKADRLTEICASWRLHPSELVYVGDLPEDADIAHRAGCHFEPASRLHDGTLAADYASPCAPSSEDGAALERVMRAGPTNHPGVAYACLRLDPANDHRQALQRAIFAGLEPAMRHCFLISSPGLFQMHRSVITNTELMSDHALRDAYRSGLGRLFPPKNLLLGTLRVRFCATYGEYGDQLARAKDYGSHGGGLGSRFHSGPNPELYRIATIADILSKQLSPDGPPLAAVPSSQPNSNHPGEVSRRLTVAVAQRSGREVADLLVKHPDGKFGYRGDSRSPREVVLVDDQLTTGTSLAAAANLLRSHGHQVDRAIVFTVKDKIAPSKYTTPSDGGACPLSSAYSEPNIACPCLRRSR